MTLHCFKMTCLQNGGCSYFRENAALFKFLYYGRHIFRVQTLLVVPYDHIRLVIKLQLESVDES